MLLLIIRQAFLLLQQQHLIVQKRDIQYILVLVVGKFKRMIILTQKVIIMNGQSPLSQHVQQMAHNPEFVQNVALKLPAVFQDLVTIGMTNMKSIMHLHAQKMVRNQDIVQDVNGNWMQDLFRQVILLVNGNRLMMQNVENMADLNIFVHYVVRLKL